MAGQGRPRSENRSRLLAAMLVVLCLAPARLALAEPENVPLEMLTDAELADVAFVDPDRGWAVGDRGVIWRTDDGGRHWRLDGSPVSCRIESLSVVDGQAFAVGGWTHPYTSQTSGVVLRTREGGRRWESIKTAALPALKQVRFTDSKNGWAVGNASALYPAGVFRSDDGGRSWSSIPGGKSQGWATGDFRDAKTGVLATEGGAVSLVVPAGIKPARVPGVDARNVHRLRLIGQHGGWLVGDGGLVLQTTNGGHTWQTPSALLPEGAGEQFDFHALAVFEKHVWIAGSPGTCVFHSADGGKTWDHFRTGQNLPLRSLMFLDEHRGWAVGALGTILATTDGGRTWRRQHGHPRAALLGVFSEASQTPLELFARLSGDEGYLGQVEILNHRPTDAVAHESDSARRAHEALVALGASGAKSAWRFPLAQPGLSLSGEAIVEGWNRTNDGRGLVRLEEHVARKIRQWRPDVIVTEAASPRGAQPLAQLINRVVLAAVELAGEGAAFPEQFAVAGLEPWKVKKVLCALPEGERAGLTLNTSQLATRLGRSLADQATPARGLIHRGYQIGPNTIAFQLPINRLPGELGQRDYFSGISLQPGGDARRAPGQPAAETLDALQRMAQKQRNIRQLLARSAGDPGSGAGWLSQIDNLTRGLGPSSSGEILYQLALRYHESGQGELAAESFELLVERCPDHPLTEAALIWLVQFYAGSEAASRTRSGTRGVEPGQRAKRAAELAKRIEETRPALYAEPAVRFPLAAAQRSQNVRGAESYYRSVVESRPHDAWRTCAGGELWLLHPGPVCPKRIWRCATATARPRLDGRLDDAVWQTAKAVDIRSAGGGDERWPAQAMLAHDREFLYLAVKCVRAPEASYTASAETRSRDADLGDHDRVDLLIDVDRDYATYYRLTVDHRGWTGEACLGDKTWNPEWFVAVGGDDFEWIVEGAIELSELGPRASNGRRVAEAASFGESQGKPERQAGSLPHDAPLTGRDAWAVGLQRTIPGVGFQSWTQPAVITSRPEGFGFLLFE